MTTQEHLEKLTGHPGSIVAAMRHLLQLQLEREAAAKPEPPAVPDPAADEIWASKDDWRAVSAVGSGGVWFYHKGTFNVQKWNGPDGWHTWVRETGARKIWPEGGGA